MDYINIGKYGDLFLFDWVKKDESVVMLGKIYDEWDGGFFMKLGGILWRWLLLFGCVELELWVLCCFLF